MTALHRNKTDRLLYVNKNIRDSPNKIKCLLSYEQNVCYIVVKISYLLCNSGASNNTMTYITKPDNSSFKVYKNHEPLQCTNMEEFWLSWSNATVQVGSGHQIGQDELITLDVSVNTSKNYLAVSTGFGALGYWIFHSGKMFLQFLNGICPLKTNMI